MGQVWKALDLTLDRTVAIKILPPAFASDPDQARTLQSARPACSPRSTIRTSLHSTASTSSTTCAISAWSWCRERISRSASRAGPLLVVDAIEVARQIALALEAAHESGSSIAT